MFLVLLVVPIVEIVAAAAVAHVIGWGWTILMLIALSLIGVWQVKVQGLGAWRSATDELANGGSPTVAVLGGALRVLAAVLLVVPGFVTAVVAMLLAWGPIRRSVATRTGHWAILRFKIPGVFDTAFDSNPTRGGAAGVVDVDGWEEAPSVAHPMGKNVLGPPRS